jgi:hypothetical protein
MSRYFKLVCLHHDPNWYAEEFHAGRARFGWSGPGSDLREIQKKDWATRSNDERVTWTYTKFLIDRIVPSDRVVIQTDQPLRSFLIGEVVPPGYAFSPGNLDDFNNVLHVKPLTTEPIPVNSKAVTAALKHDLSKRGQYYEIYPEASIRELDELVDQVAAGALDLKSSRTDEDTLDHTLRDAKRQIVREISRKWPGKDFERFCEILCREVDYIEVKERRDTGQGWDLLVRIINPLTQTILLDDVPVQCKNFVGKVISQQPIDDLDRCIRNSISHVAYLFILGHLSEDFIRALQRRKEELEKELGRPIFFEIVGEDRIADLYATYVARSVLRAQSAV